MAENKYVLKPNDTIKSCPMCGNNTSFILKSRQFSEDCCEVWIECYCGYTPFVDSGDMIEDVWGSVDKGMFGFVIGEWNNLLSDAEDD